MKHTLLWLIGFSLFLAGGCVRNAEPDASGPSGDTESVATDTKNSTVKDPSSEVDGGSCTYAEYVGECTLEAMDGADTPSVPGAFKATYRAHDSGTVVAPDERIVVRYNCTADLHEAAVAHLRNHPTVPCKVMHIQTGHCSLEIAVITLPELPDGYASYDAYLINPGSNRLLPPQ